MNQTQLLCTFSTVEGLDSTLQQIVSTYEVAFDTIYVLQNVDLPTSLCCTYNISLGSTPKSQIPDATISLHRKKATNTLYTINALNMVVSELNDGRQDKKFQVPWSEFRNCILVTAYDNFKRINTKLHKIVKVTDLK